MKKSLKKTLAVVTSVSIIIISFYGAYKTPEAIPQILGVLAVYGLALFGIKKYGNTFIKSEEK